MAGVVTAYPAPDIHANRPAANSGAVFYSCTTHSKVYRSDGSSWIDWLTLPSSGLSDPMTTRGDIIVRNASNVTARLAKGAADTFLHSDGTDVGYAAVTDAMLSTSDITTNNVSTSKHGFTPKLPNDATKYLDGTGAYTVPAGGGGGLSPGQDISYPSSFTGDTINGSSTTPFVDVAAFDTKTVDNSRVLHLQTLGASKDQRVRVTLGTTKAGAFDVTVCLQGMLNWWSAQFDVYLEVRLSTSADAQIAIARLGAAGSSSVPAFDRDLQLRVGGSSIASSGDNEEPIIKKGSPCTLRFVRDGSNVIKYYWAAQQVALALAPITERNSGTYGTVETATVSGTLARIEFAIHHPSGPSSGYQSDAWIDYLASV